MKPLKDIVFGFSDAENYRRRENKNLFDRIFVRTDAVEDLCKPSAFFLVGEKGTGKTAYAVHLSNSPYKNNKSIHKFIRETDYHKFIELRKTESLSLSDYTDIWKVIIYLLLADSIAASARMTDWVLQYPKFSNLRAAIAEYYENAFSPEIQTAFQFVENWKAAAEVLLKYAPIEAKLGGSRETSKTQAGSKFQTNLLYIEKEFQEALSSLKLSDNHILFIDGVDVRPESVGYEDYLDCVKGLANAVWSVNNDFFPSVRDSPGRMRVVFLLRPDIFNSLGLQNRNTKLKDNSVVLNWNTSYSQYRASRLFELADRMFNAQQAEYYAVGKSWDHYFPFDAKTVISEQEAYSSFILFLRYSFHRPRDILAALDTLHSLYVKGGGDKEKFDYVDLMSSEFRESYGNYLLGEIKDSLSFYYDEAEYELFLKFFEYLNGAKRFDYEEYIRAFSEFALYLSSQDKQRPGFMQSSEDFLQFLYDQNVISFIEQAEDERFIRWCFLERSTSNISPKVKTGMSYEIHYGLANVLNTGKAFRAQQKLKRAEKSEESKYLTGRIKMYNERKKFGFIVHDAFPMDIHFNGSAVKTKVGLKRGKTVRFRLEADKEGRMTAKELVVLD